MLRFAFTPRHPVTRVAFTADGREVITAQPFTSVAVRDRLTGVARLTFRLDRLATIHALAVFPGLGFIGVHTDRYHPVYDPAGAIPLMPLRFDLGYRPEVNERLNRWHTVGTTLARLAARFTPPASADSLRVAIGTDGRVALAVKFSGVPQLLPFATKVIVQVSSPLRAAHVRDGRAVIAFSPDGTKLALGDGNTLSVYDLNPVLPLFDSTEQKRATITPLLTLERPDPHPHGTHADKLAEHWLAPVAFDHAGRSLFTLGLRNRVQRIDLATGGVMCEWGWRCEPIRCLAVSPDDLTAAAGCLRGELVLWDLE